MDKDKWMRCALWCTGLFNLGGAFLFAFPSSFAGHLVGLPPDAPSIYCALLAMFVVLFAGAYAWLAVQEEIDRPLVAFSAIGKAAAVLTVSVFWFSGLLPGRGVLAVSGDLIFAGIFARWLMVSRTRRSTVSQRRAVSIAS